MKSKWFVAVCLLCCELTILLILIPGDWTKKQIIKESQYITRTLGEDTHAWIKNKADYFYKKTILDSGLYDETLRVLIPSAEERRKSRGMENMGSDWFKWIGGRVDALAQSIYQFYARVALVMVWLPYMAILFVPAIFDGYMTWLVKRSNFDYASPVLHRYAARAIGLIPVLGLALFLAPMAIDSLIVPMGMMLMCVMLGLAFGNVQKPI